MLETIGAKRPRHLECEDENETGKKKKEGESKKII